MNRFLDYMGELESLVIRFNRMAQKGRWIRNEDPRSRRLYRRNLTLPEAPAPGYKRVRHPSQRPGSVAPLRRVSPKRRSR